VGEIIKTISKKLLGLIILCTVFSVCVYAQTDEQNQTDIVDLAETEQSIDETAFLIGNAPADDNQETQEAEGIDTQSSTLWLFVRMILALVLVIALIYGIVFVLKKGFLPRESENPYLKKVASLTLAPGKTVQVITMPDKAWVVGVSDSGINLIGEITDKDLVNQMILEAEKAPTSSPKDFASILSTFTHTAKMTESTLKKQRERLQGSGRHE